MALRNGRVGGYGSRAVLSALTLASATTGSGQDMSPTGSDPRVGPAAHASRAESRAEVFATPQSAPIVTASGQTAPLQPSSRLNVPITSIKQLVQMDASSLEALYRSSSRTCVPAGKVQGRVLLFPGTKLASPASKVARLMWQGKIFKNEQSMAVNRFFGLRVIKGRVYQAESWLDGGPSLILDYQGTSLLYASYRDEIREVGPGVYLGLMYSRTTPDPTFKMYFALESRP